MSTIWRFWLLQMVYECKNLRLSLLDSINGQGSLKWTTDLYSYYATGANPDDIVGVQNFPGRPGP